MVADTGGATSGEFDLGAALVRRAGQDLNAFMAALAARLEPALPGAVVVERRRAGLFSRTSHVVRLDVALPDAMLTLEAQHGRLRARRARMVRGVTLGSEEITVPAWLEAVLAGTRALGQGADAAHRALHGFLTD